MLQNEMRKIMKELKAYESIIQNLLILNEKLIGTDPDEAEAVEDILHNLIALRDCEYDSDDFLVSTIPTCATSAVN